MLVPARDGDAAVSAVVGVADLIYEKDGRLVVADYKTDAVADDRELSERAESYRPQLELYAHAVEEALELEYTPAMELWFLSADQIVTL